MADYSITGDTRLDASGFNKGLSAMSVAAGNLISGLTQAATGKLTALAKTSVGVGMSFQSSMSQVAATMGVGVDQIQSLTDKAKEMGSTTAFTATQAADALNYLALAGYDANKAAEVLPSVLNLAAAGGMDLAYASDLVTDAMASLNLEANKQNVDEFGNKLAKAASKANANVSQLGEAILTVGGTAANLKGGTTELTTALGLLANVGIKGAEGGTHLRNIILSLQSPTDDATKLMEQLGLQVYDAQGNMRGLDDILTDLSGSLAGLTQGQKDSVINALFNKTDLAAVNGLLAAQGEQWESLAQQIDAAGEAAGDSGAMAQMAETQLDNLQGSVTIMQSALEGLQLGIYDYLEPSLNEAAKWGSECFSTLTKALSEGGPEAMLQAAGQIISDLAASVTAQLPGLATSGTEIIVQLAEDIVAATPAMLDAAAGVMAALVQGIVDNLPSLIDSATKVIVQFTHYLSDHAGDLMDAGIQLLEQLIIGITDNLPQLITAAAELTAKFSAALISHLPDLLNCGAALLTTLVDGIIRSIENLGEAALACIAKLTGVWDGSMDEWGHIGENIVNGLLNGITGMWDTLVSNVRGKVNGLVSTVKNLLGIHSPSKVFTEIGENVTQGLVNGINTGAPAAEQAIQSIAQTLSTNGPDFATVGATITEQFRTKLDEGWAQIQADIQTDALGAIETLATALKDGDLESLGLWAASYFWQACTKEQQAQIQSVAMGALNQLGSALGGVFGNLANLAMGLVAQFVPAAASATAGQTALNVAMDANPILFVISLIGMLAGALINFSGTNKNVANGFQSVWAGVEDFMSYIFEGLMRIVAAGIEGFVVLINGLIWMYNKVAWLYGGTLDYVSNPAWDYANQIAADRKARQAERKKQQEAINNPSSSGTSTNSQKVIESMTDTSKTTSADGSTVTTKVLTEKLQDETGKITQRVTKTVTEAGTKLVDGVERSYKTVTTYVDGLQTKVERSLDDIAKTTTGTKPGSTTPTAPTPDKDLTDAVEANTEALLAANSKLAEMVRQANSLVLSDNMAISRSVAASGTAQVAAAANNYHREGDTNIIQNIYSKAQTAADLQREARWEADRAKAQKR
ncbi:MULTISPECIES: phage tail tape measure protein [unclassified Faecalibacterium]|uniref:phage tail tape measure protein n=1 Tax=unclassified Faecalibacterium TaxID=2646395 RepID=UPI002014E31A|nr:MULTISPECIES: phage tail tape measure protein [unclassified Faecalibacterium]UQK47361.1 phage tail tape measure protein [Faecalibacterium sp. I2-3-92]UQK50161.1 phage tail tape measure protein [Faecalibacterium sp. IP-3-29]